MGMPKKDALLNQLDHQSFVWLTISQALLLISWLSYIPFWFFASLGVALWYRWKVMSGDWLKPSRRRKILVVATVLSLMAVTQGGFDASIATFANVLIVAFTLKGLETETKRDAITLIYLGFFIQAVLFLFDQSFLNTSFQILIMAVHFAALHAITMREPRPFRYFIKPAVLQVLFAIPLMLVFFLFFPRLPPLWTMPLANGNAQTGLSDSITPGDIANLAKSDALAFRVEFVSAPPERADLYWRALTLNYFDGKTWQQKPPGWFSSNALLSKDIRPAPLESSIELAQNADANNASAMIEYSVIAQASQRNWLFSLYAPQTSVPNTRLLADYTLYADEPLSQAFGYKMVSDLQAQDRGELNASLREISLNLPEGNELSRQWARQLFSQSANERDFVNRINNYIATNPYFYSLTPQVLQSDNHIDELWFETRTGFCAHYASAMTFMLRSVGIPARVVAGYQGGEWNKTNSYLNVRQMDAHAWVEYWLPNVGWQRTDPTAAIAPSRVQGDITDAISNASQLIKTGFASSLSSGLFNQLHWLMNDWEHNWQKWVVNFDDDEQMSIYERWLGGFSWHKLAAILAGSFVAFFMLWVGWFYWANRLKIDDPIKRRWLQLIAKLSKSNQAIHPALTTEQLLQLVHTSRDQTKWLQLSQLLNQHWYGKKAVNKRLLLRLLSQAKKWQL